MQPPTPSTTPKSTVADPTNQPAPKPTDRLDSSSPANIQNTSTCPAPPAHTGILSDQTQTQTATTTANATTTAPTTPPTSHPEPHTAQHTHWENLTAIATAATVMSLGLYILKSAGAATGGTDGIALLLSHTLHLDLGAAVFLVALPFYGLGLWQKGWLFTLRSALTVAMISGLSYIVPVALGPLHVSPIYGAIVSNILLGLGILILIRHNASPAGTVIISLLAQEKLGWRAGYVQFAIDLVIIATALTYASLPTVLLSSAGALMVGFILATNHRPGRYVAGQNV